MEKMFVAKFAGGQNFDCLSGIPKVLRFFELTEFVYQSWTKNGTFTSPQLKQKYANYSKDLTNAMRDETTETKWDERNISTIILACSTSDSKGTLPPANGA